MVCCLLCPAGPIDGDPRNEYEKEWQKPLQRACCAEPCTCIQTNLPCCMAFMNYRLRKEALGGDLDKYSCCQGYFGCCGCCSPKCEGKGACLIVESCCFPHMAIQATRFYVMDQRRIKPDTCDNRLVRCNNCLQCISCCCDCLAARTGKEGIKKLAKCVDCISDCLFCSLLGCMAAQVKAELDNAGELTSANEVMERS